MPATSEVGQTTRLRSGVLRTEDVDIRQLDEFVATRHIRKELGTVERRIRYLLDDPVLSERYPRLATSYTAIVLLYWRVFDGLAIPHSWVERALAFASSNAAGITNPWTIGRMFARVKSEYEDEVEKAVDRDKEELFRRLFAKDREVDSVMNRR